VTVESISDGFATFLGNRMRAIQVEFRQVQQRPNGGNAFLPDTPQASIATPLTKVVIDGLPADLFVFRVLGVYFNWDPFPLATRV